MTELVLALVEMVGVGITVHAYDTGDFGQMLAGIGFALLFLVWAGLSVMEEVKTKHGN